jgi:hypothetical protein
MDHEQLKLAVVADLRDSPRFTEPKAARLLGLRKLDAGGLGSLSAQAAALLVLSPHFQLPVAELLLRVFV